MTNKKTAVILFQLGGPDSLDTVEPFLFNLFSDPDIINLPPVLHLQKPVAKLISKIRLRKSLENYKSIGGKSPILSFTQSQASNLESCLLSQGINARVFIAMRYSNPSIETAIKDIKDGRFERLILLPMFPQFSQATTLSCLNEWNRQAKKHNCMIESRFICCYPDHPSLIEAYVDNINSVLNKFQNIASSDIELVFSAHGIPMSYIKHGDPYQMQVEETVEQIVKIGGWNCPHTLCYQSKIGPVKWLKPSLFETVKHLTRENRRHLLIIPISFVCDHVETLYEINIQARNMAIASGVHQFEMMPALNSHPKFIHCLSELIKTNIEGEFQSDVCRLLKNKNIQNKLPAMCPNIKTIQN